MLFNERIKVGKKIMELLKKKDMKKIIENLCKRDYEASEKEIEIAYHIAFTMIGLLIEEGHFTIIERDK